MESHLGRLKKMHLKRMQLNTSASLAVVSVFAVCRCLSFDCYWTVNTRYEVLCSLAILLEITANLYVHRRGTRYSKRGQARRQQGIPQAARQSAGSKAERKEEKERQHWLRIHKGRRKYAGKGRCRFKKRPSRQWRRRYLARGWLRPGLGRSTVKEEVDFKRVIRLVSIYTFLSLK